MSEDIWVQCDNPKCKKWRKLPPGSRAPPGNAKWYCSMNPDPIRNACNIPEEHYSDDDWDLETDQPKEPVVKQRQETKKRKSVQGQAAYGAAAKKAKAQAPGLPQQLPKFFASQAEERQHLEAALQRIVDNWGTWGVQPPADLGEQASALRLQLALPMWVWNGMHVLAPEAAQIACTAVDLLTAAASAGAVSGAAGHAGDPISAGQQHPHQQQEGEPPPPPLQQQQGDKEGGAQDQQQDQQRQWRDAVQQRFTFASLALLLAASASLEALRQSNLRRSSSGGATQQQQLQHRAKAPDLRSAAETGSTAAAAAVGCQEGGVAKGWSSPCTQPQLQQGASTRRHSSDAAVDIDCLQTSPKQYHVLRKQPSQEQQPHQQQQHGSQRQQHQQHTRAGLAEFSGCSRSQVQQQQLHPQSSVGHHGALRSAAAPPLSQLLKAQPQQPQQQQSRSSLPLLPGTGSSLPYMQAGAGAAAVQWHHMAQGQQHFLQPGVYQHQQQMQQQLGGGVSFDQQQQQQHGGAQLQKLLLRPPANGTSEALLQHLAAGGVLAAEGAGGEGLQGLLARSEGEGSYQHHHQRQQGPPGLGGSSHYVGLGNGVGSIGRQT